MDRRRCLICSSWFQEAITLRNYFSRRALICPKCSIHFVLSDVRRCPHCRKKLAVDEEACLDCEFIKQRFVPVDCIHCLYDYNDVVRSTIHQYKFHKDIVLAELFAGQLERHPMTHIDAVVPMPTSEERLHERGFDTINEIVRHTKLNICSCLKTQARKKQAELTKSERLKEDNPFFLEGTPPQKILIVDDIYTTGLTVHRAAEVLRKHSEYIEVLTFARA